MDLLSSLGFVKRETALKTVWLCVFTAINSDCVSVMLKTFFFLLTLLFLSLLPSIIISIIIIGLNVKYFGESILTS